MREGPLALHALADGALAVRGDLVVAIAASTGPLKREREWSRGLVFDDIPGMNAPVVIAFGGSWPDTALLTLRAEAGRTDGVETVLRWQDGAWTPEPPPAPAGLQGYYTAYAAIPRGPVAGLRGFSSDDVGDPDDPDAPTRPITARPVVDRLTPDGRASGPWPALPAGPAGVDLLPLADGGLVVLRSGPVVQHWAPGARAWKKLPAVGYTATGYYDAPQLYGRDPARLWLASCPDTADVVPPRLHRFDGARWRRVAPPGADCVASLAEADDGTVWLIDGAGLWRDDPDDPVRWTAVDLPTLTLPGRDDPVWRPGRELTDPWREWPAEPRAPRRLTPTRVLAVAADDVWLIATAGPARFDPAQLRSVALTTRPLAKPPPLLLPDDQARELEARAHEPELVPTSVEAACHDIVLDLGDPADIPADARPPDLAAALADADGDLRRLTVVVADHGGRHHVQVLWFADPPTPAERYELLGGLLTRLQPAHPRARLLCRTPRVVRVLP